ncbi:Proteophosphoglycan precursor [Sinorhizobium sojae CCBAU 05684]|uniref:Proteophosphoglycan n=2 Tax=Sinorhizobium sojae TaxID=716925 RepID=A0A249PD59_9HYPH|nr:Proteophosphoglycan precursor [Sinorhizobium sojae CCBAU 05684]
MLQGKIETKRDRTMAEAKIQETGDAAGLAALITRAAGQTGGEAKGLPPVERWNPPFCGDIDMEIRGDGTWFYMGTPIGRQPLVRLFSTVLRKDEDGKTYLVTPVEKVGIRVVDAPFIAVEMSVTARDGANVLTFRTNVGDVVEAGPGHPLRFVIHGETSELKPYLHVRGRLEALVSRPVMYDLVELGEKVQIDGTEMFCVRSAGAVFPIMPAAELEALCR